MKTEIFGLVIFCVSFGRGEVSVDEILDYKFDKDINGPYNFRFTTSNGHQREETAELLHEGTEYESILLRGSYQYLGADGRTYTVKYRADDNGFHPEGEHIEVPPFVPWPSKIDLTDTGGELKNPEETFNLPLEFLTTQRPPKFEYRPVGSSTVPKRYFTTPKPPGRMMVGKFNPKILRVTQQYIPTSTRKPADRGDVVSSSSSKSTKMFPDLKITREYIPTSSTPPSVKGNIQESPEVFKSAMNSFNKRRKMSRYSLPTTPPNIYRMVTKVNEIHPTITYEGRPFESSSDGEDSFSISIPKSRTYGARTKPKKIVSDFVTTEYPSVS